MHHVHGLEGYPSQPVSDASARCFAVFSLGKLGIIYRVMHYSYCGTLPKCSQRPACCVHILLSFMSHKECSRPMLCLPWTWAAPRQRVAWHCLVVKGPRATE
ncbi:uncharacterized protein LOC135378105 [Ornithodoros turicata]|uniref:uncharacterized protein LOC135378105 n=1 Tax=Ornithodoros turicata TaxID=34597 RepID=UPI003139A0F0